MIRSLVLLAALVLAGCGASPDLKTLVRDERATAAADAREWPSLTDAQRWTAFRHVALAVIRADVELNSGPAGTITLAPGGAR